VARALTEVEAQSIKQLAQNKWRASGLTDQQAQKLKYKALNGAQAQKLSSKFYNAGALLIPYFNLAGKPTRFFRLRYLEPLPGVAGLVEKPQRYDQLSMLQEAYYPPLLDLSWQELAADASQALCITEGELKAACACANGIPMMALGGVYSFMSSKRGIDLLPSMKQFSWKDRDVYIVYDNDVAFKLEVMKAQQLLAQKLLSEGARVLFITIPPGPEKGVDDYIVKHGVEAFSTLIENAEPFPEAQALWKLNEEVVFIKKIDVVIERETNLLMDPEKYKRHLYVDRFYMKSIERGSGKTARIVLEEAPLAPRWMEWKHKAQLWDLTYAPGEPKVTHNSWNAWNGWGVVPKKGNVAPWSWLLDFLFDGDQKTRKYFEQWCAYPIQHPGAKLYTAALIWSRVEGLGKSMAGLALKTIYGENGVLINAKQLRGDFNTWAKNRQLVVGEEISASGARVDTDFIKDIITSPEFTINEKHKPQYVHPNHTNFLLFSNHPDAATLSDKDRRFLIHAVPHKTPAPREKYEWVNKWLNGAGPHGSCLGPGPSYLMDHLLKLSLRGFNPREHAPATISKSEMIIMGKSDIALWVLRLQEDPKSALKALGQTLSEGCDLYTSENLYKAFDPQDRNAGKSSHTSMGVALSSAGFRALNNGKPIGTASGIHRLYAVRNNTNWEQAPRKELKEHYDLFFGPKHKGAVK